MRADLLLVQRGLAASRSQAQRLIEAGARWQAPGGWRALAKSDDLPENAQVELLDAAEARYVSRGGLKLEGALATAGIDVAGLHCLDVGQSTGGFTDCLLAHGAAHVTGIDVGHGQLHEKLRGDARVTAIEGVNARGVTPASFGGGRIERSGEAATFDLIVGDLSFISLTLVLPALAPLLREGGRLLMLVKPQFELQPGQLGKGGIVRDASLYAQVQARLYEAVRGVGLNIEGWLDSPIRGGDGNREFFIHARKP